MEFLYVGHGICASRGCNVALTSREMFGWIEFMQCGGFYMAFCFHCCLMGLFTRAV